jgi:hypothetical protein
MSQNAIPAALSAVAVVLSAAAIGTAIIDRARPEAAPAATPVMSVDETCVAVLSHGGRPQDCSRMYLTSEFPGYPR